MPQSYCQNPLARKLPKTPYIGEPTTVSFACPEAEGRPARKDLFVVRMNRDKLSFPTQNAIARQDTRKHSRPTLIRFLCCPQSRSLSTCSRNHMVSSNASSVSNKENAFKLYSSNFRKIGRRSLDGMVNFHKKSCRPRPSKTGS